MKYLLCLALLACSSLPEPQSPAEKAAMHAVKVLAENPKFRSLSVECAKLLLAKKPEECSVLAKDELRDTLSEIDKYDLITLIEALKELR